MAAYIYIVYEMELKNGSLEKKEMVAVCMAPIPAWNYVSMDGTLSAGSIIDLRTGSTDLEYLESIAGENPSYMVRYEGVGNLCPSSFEHPVRYFYVERCLTFSSWSRYYKES